MTTPEVDTPRPACPVCHRTDPAGQSWAVCDRCVQRTDHRLADLLDLVALANTPAALQPATSGGTIGSPRREPPLPVDIAVLDLAVGESVLAVLEQWERWWREAFSLIPYGVASAAYAARTRQNGSRSDSTAEQASGHPCPNLSGTVAFLRAWWPRAATVTEPPPDEFADEVHTLHRRAEAALRLLEPSPWTVPCPSDLGDRECGYRLRVEDYGAGLRMRCPRCGADWTTDRLLLVAHADGRAVWVDQETAADRLGTTPRGLAILVRTGRIRRKGNRYDITPPPEDEAAG